MVGPFAYMAGTSAALVLVAFDRPGWAGLIGVGAVFVQLASELAR